MGKDVAFRHQISTASEPRLQQHGSQQAGELQLNPQSHLLARLRIVSHTYRLRE
jgi:hypothetical protein